MEIIFSPRALEDLKYWRKSGNKIIQNKIAILLIAIRKTLIKGSVNQSH